MGRNFQGRDDHSGRDRSPGPSLCNPGTEHPELPHGTSQEESGRGLGVRRSKVTINVFSFEQQKRGGRWAVEKAALGNPAKTAGFPFFPQPRLLAISQTTSGNLIVVDRKECLTPDTEQYSMSWFTDGKKPSTRVEVTTDQKPLSDYTKTP